MQYFAQVDNNHDVNNFFIKQHKNNLLLQKLIKKV